MIASNRNGKYLECKYCSVQGKRKGKEKQVKSKAARIKLTIKLSKMFSVATEDKTHK